MGTEDRPPEAGPTRRKRGRPPHPDILTPREWQVLGLLRQGLTNEQIAQRLDISYATAKYHVSEIISKLGVQTREEAAVWERPLLGSPRWWRRGVVPLAAGATALALLSAGLGILALSGDTGPDEQSTLASEATNPATPGATGTTTTHPTALGSLITPLENTVVSEDGPYIFDVESGQLHRFRGGFGLGEAWSPDSTALLNTSPLGIDVIDVGTGEGTRILSGDVVAASWSADSFQIVFTRRSDGPSITNGLFVVNRDGTGLKQISDVEGPGGMVWSPRGDRIAYWIAFKGRYLIDPQTGAISELSPTHPSTIEQFAWSPEGDSIALIMEAGLELHDVDSGAVEILADGPAEPPLMWSPDGEKIAFRYGEPYENQEGELRALHVVELDSDDPPRRVALAFSSSWSPDSTSIAHLGGGCADGDWDFYVTEVTTGSTTRLTDSTDLAKEGGVWSPNGSYVAFSTSTEVILLDAGSGSATSVALLEGWPDSGHMHVWQPPNSSWSPDGRYLLFGGSGGHGICM
jgi:Tol biopolymer transport system component/DNA-binding CsgD family transcriptional regulator